MKIIDKLILKAYLGPFFATLTVLQFIFLMQFLWKYIDDLVGKGLDTFVILELLYYSNYSLIPMTLPLSVLLSAIMSMGNLSEHFELTALKSSGVSFLRILRPLLIVSVLMSGVAFIFSNNLMPWASLKQKTLLREIMRKKLEVNLIEGVFYTGFDQFSIRVNKKHDNGEDVEDVTIYKFGVKGNTTVVKANTGVIKFTESRKYLIVDLFDGYTYEEQFKQHGVPKESFKHSKTYFKEQLIRFDMTSFKLGETDEKAYDGYARMMTLNQLIDYQVEVETQVEEAYQSIDDRTKHTIDVFNPAQDTIESKPVELRPWKEIIQKSKMTMAMNLAKSNVNSTMNRLTAGYNRYDRKTKLYRKVIIEKHKKFTLSYAVLVLFLVGAPLGSIIRKGGMGLPIVISVIFFLIYYMLTVYGEKSVLKNQVNQYFGMWITNAVFTPIGIIFMYQSATDSPIFDRDYYKKKFKKWFKKK